MREIRGLRVKFVVSNMLMVTALLCLALFAIGFFNNSRLEQRSLELLEQEAAAGSGAGTFLEGDGRIPHFSLILNRDRELIGLEGQYSFGVDDAALRRLAAESISAREDRGIMEQYQLRYLRFPTEEGYRIMYVDTSIGSEFTAGMWRSLFLTGGAVWLCFLGVSLLLSKWAVSPVEKALQREKQFIADSSHELKTPLTVIMANGELLSGEDKTPEEARRWTANILQEAVGMKKLVEELLELARSEAPLSAEKKSRVNLSDLVIESVLSFEAVFFQNGRELLSDVEEGIFVRGAETELRRLICILLDNAEKYSEEGGSARVELRSSGRRVCLTVSNTGEPIPEDRMKELFERFYRGDAARSDQKGYGLGLSIAKNIAERNRVRIHGESGEGENRFILEFRAEKN